LVEQLALVRLGRQHPAKVLVLFLSLAEDLTVLPFTQAEAHKLRSTSLLLLIFVVFAMLSGMPNNMASSPNGADFMIVASLFESAQALLYAYYANFAAEATAIYTTILAVQLILIVICTVTSAVLEQSSRAGFVTRDHFIDVHGETATLGMTLILMLVAWLLIDAAPDPILESML
jgi:hypothetical protein